MGPEGADESDDPEDRRILREGTERSGAVVLGPTLFELVDGPDGWNDEVGYGARRSGRWRSSSSRPRRRGPCG